MRGRVEAIDDIATLPEVLTRIIAVVQDESTTALDLADEIVRDQALAMRVLRVVNSSFYGFPRAISNIPEAVVILGFNEIERLALTISVINIFGKSPAHVRALHNLWRHSLACSLAAGTLEQHFRRLYPEIAGAHLAGLLHDIGKAVIIQYFPDELTRVIHMVESLGCSAYEAEYEVFGGITHGEIGAWLAERWQLPEVLVQSIAGTHRPSDVPGNPIMPHATHLADALVNMMGIGALNDQPQALSPNPESLERLPLDEGLVTRIQERLNKQRGLLGAVAVGALS
ncbi:MAG TPA: HDOD domain-containing protein [Candidatus Hydrogenedentes bacterium]|jgi:putative nucleotidyltransferase with HDIG domain|nr:HDOD domain-containing protein [Candidatus Hydrogenedentota bacterium]HPJ97945.1 HDOD domain-containing protein [Candidatus Hydrogenedentota bacterium]